MISNVFRSNLGITWTSKFIKLTIWLLQGDAYWYVTGGQKFSGYFSGKLRAVLDLKNILITSQYIKARGSMAFFATALQYFGEKLSLSTHFV